jgi:RES domain-containing protein
VSHTLWRIATDTKDYEADDPTGAGAKITGGRWNAVGEPMGYASETIALACLESVVHLNSGLPFNRYLVSVTVPDDLWAGALRCDASTLPVGWDAEPPGSASPRVGGDWLASRATALLVVPSVIVPEERNILINPLDPDAGRIALTMVRRWLYDPRLAKDRMKAE